MEISALSSLLEKGTHSLFRNQFIYLFVSVILRIKARLSNMLSKHTWEPHRRLLSPHQERWRLLREQVSMQPHNTTRRILGIGGDRCLSHLQTLNPEARATLTIYHPLALEHLQVNQLLQRNQKIPVSPGPQASTQMEDLYYIPHDSSADNKPRLWGHTVLFPTTKPGKARTWVSSCESAVFSRALTMDEPLRVLERRESSKIRTLRYRS